MSRMGWGLRMRVGERSWWEDLLGRGHALVHAKLLQSCHFFAAPIDCLACLAPLSWDSP